MAKICHSAHDFIHVPYDRRTATATVFKDSAKSAAGSYFMMTLSHFLKKLDVYIFDILKLVQ